MAKANRKANNNSDNIRAVERAIELMHLERAEAGKPNMTKFELRQ